MNKLFLLAATCTVLITAALLNAGSAQAGHGSFWQSRDLTTTPQEEAGAKAQLKFIHAETQKTLLDKLGPRTVLRLGGESIRTLYFGVGSVNGIIKIAKSWDTEEVLALIDELKRHPHVFDSDHNRFDLRRSLYRQQALKNSGYRYASRVPYMTLMASRDDADIDKSEKHTIFDGHKFMYPSASEFRGDHDLSRLHPNGTLFVVVHGQPGAGLSYNREVVRGQEPVPTNVPVADLVKALLDPSNGLPLDFHGQIKLKSCSAGLDGADGSPSAVTSVAQALSAAGRADITVSGAKGIVWASDKTDSVVSRSEAVKEITGAICHYWSTVRRSYARRCQLALANAELAALERHGVDVKYAKTELDQLSVSYKKYVDLAESTYYKSHPGATFGDGYVERLSNVMFAERFWDLLHAILERDRLCIPKREAHVRVVTGTGGRISPAHPDRQQQHPTATDSHSSSPAPLRPALTAENIPAAQSSPSQSTSNTVTTSQSVLPQTSSPSASPANQTLTLPEPYIGNADIRLTELSNPELIDFYWWLLGKTAHSYCTQPRGANSKIYRDFENLLYRVSRARAQRAHWITYCNPFDSMWKQTTEQLEEILRFAQLHQIHQAYARPITQELHRRVQLQNSTPTPASSMTTPPTLTQRATAQPAAIQDAPAQPAGAQNAAQPPAVQPAAANANKRPADAISDDLEPKRFAAQE